MDTCTRRLKNSNIARDSDPKKNSNTEKDVEFEDPKKQNPNGFAKSNFNPREWCFKNSFEDVPPPEEDKLYQTFSKLLLIFVAIFVFILVLGGGVVSKLAMLLMTARLNVDATTSGSKEMVSSEVERQDWAWLIYAGVLVFELLNLFQAGWIWILQGQKLPSFLEFGILSLLETLHTVGLSLFVFLILPSLDSMSGAMLCSSVSLVPGILAVFSRTHRTNCSKFYKAVDLASVFLQGLTIFPIFFPQYSIVRRKNYWLLPTSLVLMSFKPCLNYFNKNSKHGFIRYMAKLQLNLQKSGCVTYTFISIWKMILFLVMMIFIVGKETLENLPNFYQFLEALHFNINEEFRFFQSLLLLLKSPFFLFVLGTILVSIGGTFAFKVRIHQFSLALPLTLVTPLTLCLITAVDPCLFSNPFMDSLQILKPSGNYSLLERQIWIWFLWFLSQCWITNHVWFSHSEAFSSTEDIFNSPIYFGFLMDQFFALNLPRYKVENEGKIESKKISCLESQEAPMIYACVTMWHETEDEMLNILKSLLRMDKDHCVHRIAAEKLRIYETYYDFESHIIFDDAFQHITLENSHFSVERKINEFVRRFLRVYELTLVQIYENKMRIEAPVKYNTPYGCRIEWKLPGQTLMVLHLKDASKARVKKRWSQVLYMNYLLGHKISEFSKTMAGGKEARARNTFVLTLDGDVSFQPWAVLKLLKAMKRNPNVGGMTGRLYPTGKAGFILSFQKYDFAYNYWIGKTTEDILGCVTCACGCFSLFRASAIIGERVLGKFGKVSKDPWDKIQHDFGEDRWLTMLLIENGYRVGFDPTCSVHFHAPETFEEFYKQRKRWIISTISNSMYLIWNFRKIHQSNSDISFIYILYQLLLLIGSILGPSLIFSLMLNIVVRFLQCSNWLSAGLNLIPILTFSLTCFFGELKHQLLITKVFSIPYGLILMGTLVPAMLALFTQNIFSSRLSILLVSINALVLTSGLFHPLELSLLVYIFFFLAMLPSLMLFLQISSIININSVSWGTREKVITLGKLKEVIVQLSNPTNYIPLCQNLVALSQKTIEDEAQDDWNRLVNFKYASASGPENMNFKLKNMSDTEVVFWTELLEQGLNPEDDGTETREACWKFRNDCVLLFFLLNIFAVFSFHVEGIHLEIQLGFTNMIWTLQFLDITIQTSMLVMLFQFACLLISGYKGLLVISASTRLCARFSKFWDSKTKQKETENMMIMKNGTDLINALLLYNTKDGEAFKYESLDEKFELNKERFGKLITEEQHQLLSDSGIPIQNDYQKVILEELCQRLYSPDPKKISGDQEAGSKCLDSL